VIDARLGEDIHDYCMQVFVGNFALPGYLVGFFFQWDYCMGREYLETKIGLFEIDKEFYPQIYYGASLGGGYPGEGRLDTKDKVHWFHLRPIHNKYTDRSPHFENGERTGFGEINGSASPYQGFKNESR